MVSLKATQTSAQKTVNYSLSAVYTRPSRLLEKPLDLNGIQLRNRVFLAPMSGVTDAPFRSLAWHFGAGLVVSEMVASEALAEGSHEMRQKASAVSGASVHMVQLAGREEKWLALAAQMAEGNGAAVIDINLGCPAKRVTTGMCGSALMREPQTAISLIEAVVNSVNVPVTVKMRLGWDEHSINAPDLARQAQESGAAMVTVHGRTRCQFYKGDADWRAIRAVRDRISIPLVVNGDIRDLESALRALQQSGADAVMIGRAAYGAPWLPGQLCGNDRAQGGAASIGDTAIEHYQSILHFYGRELGNRCARKHLSWYFDRLNQGIDAGLRRTALTSQCPETVAGTIKQIFSQADTRKAA
jgi:tRNA-dihydrouridine synthase B